MAKEEGAKTVVVGGKRGIEQRYCGTVGGQSTDFSTIDTEVKVRHDPTSHTSRYIYIAGQTTLLKNNTLAPPDLYVEVNHFLWYTKS